MLYAAIVVCVSVAMALNSPGAVVRILKACGAIALGLLVIPWAVERWDRHSAWSEHMASLDRQAMIADYVARDAAEERVRCTGLIAAGRGITIDPLRHLVGDEARAAEELFQCRQRYGPSR